MKKSLTIPLFLLISSFAVAVGCDEQDGDTANDPPIEGTLLGEGSFQGVNGYSASGTASIIEDDQGRLRIRLESNFQVSSGNLDIYISDGPEVVSQSMRIGNLKASAGAQNYTTDEGTLISDFTHVIIFCTDFDVEFGHAEITEVDDSEEQ